MIPGKSSGTARETGKRRDDFTEKSQRSYDNERRWVIKLSRLEEDRYRVMLKYDKQDETEMVIRILSFGPVIEVKEPDSFIALLRERLKKQEQLSASVTENSLPFTR